jgi:uncharacterized phiE125 gp8 family phage protein
MYRGYTIGSNATPVVTTADMKAYLKVDTSADDTLIAALVSAATRWVENYLGRSLLTKTVVEKWDCFPKGSEPIVLRLGPVLSSPAAAITYLDTDGATVTTWDATNYALDNSGALTRARIVLAQSAFYPSTAARLAAVTISYSAGYGATAASVPDDIVTAVKILVADLYQNREPVVRGKPTTVENLIQPYRFEPGC